GTSSTSSNNSSCVGSGDNLSGSSLTFPNPIPAVSLVPISGVNYSSPSTSSLWSTNSLSNFSSSSAPLSPLSEVEAPATTTTTFLEREKIATSPTSSSTELQRWNWDVIRTFLYVVSIVGREIRTLSSALLIGLLVNPINYCICSFSPSLSRLAPAPLFSSIGRAVPGGSSSRYYCCKRRNIISSGCRSTATTSTAFLTLFRCCCTCNCISFLRPVFGECCNCSSCAVGGTVSKDNSNGGGGAPGTHHSSRTVVGKPRLGKMAQILSKTMTLLGVAFVIHFIIMSTFAEKEGKDLYMNES
ncbi:unnamed protein product, partial [Orchesella dallaii]